MTENLSRLIVVAKEKERLESELEIAREVQSNLFPKNAPWRKPGATGLVPAGARGLGRLLRFHAAPATRSVSRSATWRARESRRRC